MKKLHGEEASTIYTPKAGHEAVIYTLKFKPEHYREGVKLVTSHFPDAQMQTGQKRHNIFLKRPSTHEVVNVTFFDEGASVAEWHESDARLRAVEKMRPMLDGPLDIQVYEVESVIGTTR